MKLKELLDMENALAELSKCKLPVKTSYKISKFLLEFDAENKIFQGTRLKFAQELGEQEGDTYVFKDNGAEFGEKMQELLNLSVCETFKKLTVDELGEIDIAPITLANLAPMLE